MRAHRGCESAGLGENGSSRVVVGAVSRGELRSQLVHSERRWFPHGGARIQRVRSVFGCQKLMPDSRVTSTATLAQSTNPEPACKRRR